MLSVNRFAQTKKDKKTQAVPVFLGSKVDARFIRHIEAFLDEQQDGTLNFVWYSQKDHATMTAIACDRRDDPADTFMEGAKGKFLLELQKVCVSKSDFQSELKSIGGEWICMNSNKCEFKCWAVQGLTEVVRTVKVLSCFCLFCFNFVMISSATTRPASTILSAWLSLKTIFAARTVSLTCSFFVQGAM